MKAVFVPVLIFFFLWSLGSLSALASHTGSVKVITTGYLYPTGSGRTSNFTLINANLNSEADERYFNAKSEGSLLLFLQPTASPYLQVSELYFGTPKSMQSSSVVFGRKLEPWSTLDQVWGLGLFQPRFRWDYLYPTTVGLTGFFGTVRSEKFTLTGWLSPFFIPDQGASLQINSEGDIVSDSAWFIPPVRQVNYAGQDIRVRYQLKIPPLSEIILKPGGALRAHMKSKNSWLGGAYAYKPMNQLALAHDGKDLDLVTQDIPVSIYPRVQYHHLFTLEAGLFDQEHWSLGSAVVRDLPISETFPSAWTAQQFAPATVYTAFFNWKANFLQIHPRFSLSFLKVDGGNAPDKKPELQAVSFSEQASQFENRYPFETAFKFNILTQLPGGFAKRFHFDASWTYDLGQSGFIWSNLLRYRTDPSWELDLGVDFLTAKEDSASNSFIYRYRSNDRVFAGLKYVF